MRQLIFALLLGACSPPRAAAPFILWTEVKRVFDYRCHLCHNSSNSIGNWSRKTEAESRKDDINFQVCIAKTMPIGYISKPEREMICTWSQQ